MPLTEEQIAEVNAQITERETQQKDVAELKAKLGAMADPHMRELILAERIERLEVAMARVCSHLRLDFDADEVIEMAQQSTSAFVDYMENKLHAPLPISSKQRNERIKEWREQVKEKQQAEK